MLKSLNIENIAIIESASIDFRQGLNILTGETGAGKSIIIDSINTVTGEKTSRDLIRSGENSANVSALFENISDNITSELKENALPAEEDGTLLLQRRISRDGKNICRINGASVTVSMLKKFGMDLINIHGQRDSQSLLNSDKHIDFLDEFAKDNKLLNDYISSYNDLMKIRSEISKLKTDDEYKARRIDILTYQINELKNANIYSGERDKLHKQKNILSNSEKLRNALVFALKCLNGDSENGGASGLINEASSEIISVSSLAKGLDTLTDSLGNAASQIEQTAGLIEDVLNQLQNIDGNLEDIDSRLDLLYRLSQKYGETEEEMLDFLNSAEAELESINTSEARLKNLQREYDDLYFKTTEKAEKISSARKIAAKQLSKEIKNELTYLDMPTCRFIVNLTHTSMNEKGCDNVEFLISANTGEAPKPLAKVASGGELSRIMLAMKNILNSGDGVDTLIFDEIDTGVSGSAAGRIAEKLSEVSKNTQVLCITHLAQIAAFADAHKYIYKEVKNGKTFTRVKDLNNLERPQELARMTAGIAADDIQIEAARQMIKKAEEYKNKE